MYEYTYYKHNLVEALFRFVYTFFLIPHIIDHRGIISYIHTYSSYVTLVFL